MPCGELKPTFPQSLAIALGFSIVIGLFGVVSGPSAVLTPALVAAFPFLAAAPAAVIGAAALGAFLVFGFVLGWAIGKEFHVRKHQRQQICVAGVVDHVDNSEDDWYLSIFWDPDRSMDVVLKSSMRKIIEFEASYVRCSDSSPRAEELHMEINSNVPRAAHIGGVVGAGIGAVFGTVAGIAAGIAIGSLACGPLAWACFLLALLVAFIVAAVITAAGAWVGGVAGGGIGKALDANDADVQKGKMVHDGVCITARGDWVIDLDHGWNEMHPIKSFALHGDFPHPPPYSQSDADSPTCPNDCP